jgi:hypothetical protein
MPLLKKPVELEWTLHAQAKMRQYRLTPSRVRHVLHSPKRIEEGVAPKTIAMMQPASMKTKDMWAQEIWVMIQEVAGARKVISAWRYPGVTKPRSTVALGFLREQYQDFVNDAVSKKRSKA